MKLLEAQRVLMLGVAGTGMRGLATLLVGRGVGVLGVDEQFDNGLPQDGFEDVEIVSEKEAESVTVDVVVFTDAAERDHPVLKAAERRGVNVLAYHEALGEFASNYTTVAVTGTHGKTSTTAMLGHILIEAGKDPSVLIGATIGGWGDSNARVGAGDLFVVEADEYREHFLTLKPAQAIVTTIEHDHPDYFESEHDVLRSYAAFVERVDPDGAVVISSQLAKQFTQFPWPTNTFMVEDTTDDVVVANMPGDHMRQNAALAVALAVRLGVAHDTAWSSLQTFPGVGRRMEELGFWEELLLVTDYGHHPTEIEVTIAAAREKYASARIVAVFEAHTLERLKAFYPDYVAALRKADAVLVVPVFVPKGREDESTEAARMQRELVTDLEGYGVEVSSIDGFDALRFELMEVGSAGSVVIGFTAGRLDQRLRDVVRES